MKRKFYIIIFIFCFFRLFGQEVLPEQIVVKRKVDKVLQADTIWFEVRISGCFGGGGETVKIIKQSVDSFIAKFTDFQGKTISSTINKKQLYHFGKLFSNELDGNKSCGCTLAHKFILSSENGKIHFKENCCRDHGHEPKRSLLAALGIIEE